jgi:hypothetical protein
MAVPVASASPLLLLKKKSEWKCPRKLRGRAKVSLEDKETSALSKSHVFNITTLIPKDLALSSFPPGRDQPEAILV